MAEVAGGSFDDLADAYDAFRIGYSDDIYEALAEYGLAAGSRVLDLGCGTGLVAAELQKRGAYVTGVDISDPMLARARRRVPGATFVLGGAESIPFPDASFDAAVCAQAFHWFDHARALAELSRVVRPGGLVAVWWKGLMRGDCYRLLREDCARDVGLTPPGDLLTAGFEAFETSSFVDRKLRVIPWWVRMPSSAFIGYERSRARSRDAFGAKQEAYLQRLTEKLPPPDVEIALSYTHLLYMGHVPERAH